MEWIIVKLKLENKLLITKEIKVKRRSREISGENFGSHKLIGELGIVNSIPAHIFGSFLAYTEPNATALNQVIKVVWWAPMPTTHHEWILKPCSNNKTIRSSIKSSALQPLALGVTSKITSSLFGNAFNSLLKNYGLCWITIFKNSFKK